MDEINDFFSFPKEFKKKSMPKGFLSGNPRSLCEPPKDSEIFRKPSFRNKYAEEAIKTNEENISKLTGEKSYFDEMENLDEASNSCDSDRGSKKSMKRDDQIYAKFDFHHEFDDKLPIFSSKEKILKAIKQNPVVVLEGDTGCGKTTQVPQYILADAFDKQEYCNIVVTQPRRIAAISIARRVCMERQWPDGSLVGYQIGLHAHISENTRILYCTTGVLLQKIVREKSLGKYTHIILDEVHERDHEMDFLLIAVRKLLMTTCKHAKIILMSATIDSNQFSQYFKINNSPAPIIKVDSRSLYQVSEYYLNDLERINIEDIQIEFGKPGIPMAMYVICAKLVLFIDNIVKYGNNNGENSKNNAGSILIFLPGLNEIDILHKKLTAYCSKLGNKVKMHLIRLHSLISPDEQIKIFRKAPPGFIKVILSTNIAESSITVPDVKYVIDFCLTKVLVSDSSTSFSTLELKWASKSNCRQRAGRAGRVSNGRVYRLVPKDFYDNEFEEFAEPEMLRCPLENVVLKCKLLDMGSPPFILGLAMNPPNLIDIGNTILKLKELGALYLESSEAKYDPFDGVITFMGRVMASLPLDVRLSKLIIFGYIFSVLEDAIIIAAGLSVRSIFRYYSNKVNHEVTAYLQKLRWSDGSSSDLFAILRAYHTWVHMRERHINNTKSEEYWADNFYLNLRSLKEMYLIIEEVKNRLESFGIKDPLPHDRIRWTGREHTIIIKILIAGAFYPNYFVISNANNLASQRNAYQILSGHDPCSTVYFSGFNNRHIGPLYGQSIKDFFKCIGVDPQNIEAHFPNGTQRIYIKFKSPDLEEKRSISDDSVRHEIRKALYLRMLGIGMRLQVMDYRSEIEYLETRQIGQFIDGVWHPSEAKENHFKNIFVPSFLQKTVKGFITHIEDCNKFYFQPIKEMKWMKKICSVLAKLQTNEFAFKHPSEVIKGMVVAAPFEKKYYRGTILKVLKSDQQETKYLVQFIDYGNTECVEFADLRFIPEEMSLVRELPRRCFVCRLAHVKPSSYNSTNGQWLDEAMELLQKEADEGVIDLEIYSVVAGVVNVILKCEGGTFNEILVRKSLAQSSEENYMSKCDHDFRCRKQSMSYGSLDDENENEFLEYKRSVLPVEEIKIGPPEEHLCEKTISLKGPFSPLETKLQTATAGGSFKMVTIERESVNSVLLDSNPQDIDERLMVAASISENSASDILTARSTTLMPNFRGFGALMTMLFCPKLQLKVNKQGTKFIAILAGLGYDSTNIQALHPEHDIVLHLDAEILPDDIEVVNQIRYCMDAMLYTDMGAETISITSKNRFDISQTLKATLSNLLNKTRKYIEITKDSTDCCWSKEDPEELIGTPQLFGTRSLFPLHSIPRLKEKDETEIAQLVQHCKQLHLSRKLENGKNPSMCKLCNQDLENLNELRIHLLSQMHLDQESQIGFSPTD